MPNGTGCAASRGADAEPGPGKVRDGTLPENTGRAACGRAYTGLRWWSADAADPRIRFEFLSAGISGCAQHCRESVRTGAIPVAGISGRSRVEADLKGPSYLRQTWRSALHNHGRRRLAPC